MTAAEPTPREVFEHLLCHGGVKIAVLGRANGVELPEHVRDLDPLVLWYELEAVVPIPDLEVTDAGIRATLSFSRMPCATFVPWAAVYQMATLRPEKLQEKKPRAKLRSV